MGMDNYTPHQQKIIKRYYENADQISLQKLAELCTELYLAEGKKKAKLWEQAATLMEKLNVPASRIATIVASGKPELVANVVKELT